MGFHGATEIETPHLDRLAHSGVTFTNGYVAAPTCGPSRAGLITGRYPARFGTDYNWPFAPFDTAHGLPVEELTLAKRLRRAGYRTGFVGKWHLGAAPPFQPLVRGFDSFFGFLGGNRDYFRAETSPGTRPDLLPLLDGWGATGFTGYLTDALTDQAVDFIESDSSLLDSLGERAPLLDRVVGLFHRRKRAPFLLVLSYNAPHDPLQAPPELIEKYAHIADEDRRAYLAMVDSLDQGVGRVLNALESTGQRSNTVVFFLSDNGGVYPTPGRDYLTWADNAPFRGGKTSFHEGGIRVPFVASWPARWPRGATFEPMVISLDIAATALGVAGVAVHPKPPLDGVDLDPFVRGAASGVPHEALFWRYWTPEGRYTGYAIRVGDRKLVRRHYGRDHELFDLGADPGETHDLSLEEPETVERLADRWNAWNRGEPGRAIRHRSDLSERTRAVAQGDGRERRVLGRDGAVPDRNAGRPELRRGRGSGSRERSAGSSPAALPSRHPGEPRSPEPAKTDSGSAALLAPSRPGSAAGGLVSGCVAPTGIPPAIPESPLPGAGENPTRGSRRSTRRVGPVQPCLAGAGGAAPLVRARGRPGPPETAPGWRRASAPEPHRGAVGEDLGGGGHDHRGRDPQPDDRIGAERLGVLGHPRDRLLAALGHELRVGLDLAADDSLESGEEVAAEVAGADRVAAGDAEDFGDPGAGNLVGGGKDHRRILRNGSLERARIRSRTAPSRSSRTPSASPAVPRRTAIGTAASPRNPATNSQAP